MAYHGYQHDEVMFYDTDEQPALSWDEIRRTHKMMSWERQEQVANELSRLASDEYMEDIMQHLRHMEDETLPDVNLIDMQREIQWFMRPFLMDFIIEAHNAFRLLPETLFLTINLLDRYCSKRIVYKNHYQLVACASLLIAAKYTDKKERVPQISELNRMCCGLYDSGMFTQMEMHVLNTLEWVIGHPTVDFFTQIMVTEERDDKEVEHMTAYLCEVALYHRDFVSTKPSVLARASLALARAILGRPEVNDGEWGQAENDTYMTLFRYLAQPSVVLSKKYSSSSFSRVSKTLAEFMRRQAELSRRNAAAAAAAAAATAAAAAAATTATTVQVTVEPASSAGNCEMSEDVAVCATPHVKAATRMCDGYPTPPITPDGASFAPGMHPKEQFAARSPVTPTRNHLAPQHHHHHQAQQQHHHNQAQYQPQAHSEQYSRFQNEMDYTMAQ
ncbi:hypothetical protein TD95_005166 [Thielaviopsis punctulata]|uniref:Uncharacterized protein n=1 Tax=Thielaviopsis punctulata TaxID=72032 RepID=A0A0F4ZHN3_9PEZI|nr:hypothetical protein TD95_005166 [Thielaviopsis punctulata]